MIKSKNSSGSNESFKSAHSSLTVVPSKGSIRSSVTIKGDRDSSSHSVINNSIKTTVPIIKHGAKSNTIKPVGKAGTPLILKRAKSVGNVPKNVGPVVVEEKKPVVVTVEETKLVEQKEPVEGPNPVPPVERKVKSGLNKCSHISSGTRIASSEKYHSDHNPVAVYLPGLFDGRKNAYVITYNEKGNTPDSDTVYNSFLSTLHNLTDVDMIFIGIQEGDVYTTFIKCMIAYLNTARSTRKLPVMPFFTSDSSIKLAIKAVSVRDALAKDWNLTKNTYESTGKECLKKFKGVCLVNGCYVLLKNGSGLTVEDSGKDIITKGGVLNTTKHCAWAVIKEGSSNVKHVFTSCHLEYSGKYNPEKKDLLAYDKRREQLTGYINMLYNKYAGVSRFIFCGDTNMRMLTSATYEYEIKKKYILDQMLYYLMQCDKSKSSLKSIDAVTKYSAYVPKTSEYIDGKHVLSEHSDFWSCVGCDIALGRKMLLYRLGGFKTFCSHLHGLVKDPGPKSCKDQTEIILGSYIFNKFSDVNKYIDENKDSDKFAGYCMNPDFVVGDNKFRAYDFSYKDLTTNCTMKTIWDVYNYKPTAIFTLKGRTTDDGLLITREFDYDKRVKSGNILAPAVVDRVFMFEPYKQYVSIDNTKVGFVKY